MDAFEIIAHRGSSFLAPENTLASVNLAWEEGADAVEGDFRLTRDGAIIAMHDASLLRTGRVDRLIHECTLEDLQAIEAGSWKAPSFAGESIPTLATLLATIPKGKRFYVEVKCGTEIVPALQRVVRGTAATPEQVVFISLDLRVIAAIKTALPEYPAYWVVDFRLDDKGQIRPTIDEMISQAKLHRLDGLDLCAKGPLDASMIQQIRIASLELCVWTVDDPIDAQRMLEIGVRRITTNRPGWLRKELAG